LRADDRNGDAAARVFGLTSIWGSKLNARRALPRTMGRAVDIRRNKRSGRVFSETFLSGIHPTEVSLTNAGAALCAPNERMDAMFARLSAAVAALLLLAGGAFAQQAAKLTDRQIAHIAYTAGEIDIAAAKQALSKSKDKAVVAFAHDMVRDHEAVNKQAMDLVKKLKVKPEDNDTSKALSKQAAEKKEELSKLSGAAFDKAYIDNEVAYHKTVNNALEKTLIPSATNAELKEFLQTGLKIFEGHQKHAEHVAAELK
jgi:putative membrane protein